MKVFGTSTRGHSVEIRKKFDEKKTPTGLSKIIYHDVKNGSNAVRAWLSDKQDVHECTINTLASSCPPSLWRYHDETMTKRWWNNAMRASTNEFSPSLLPLTWGRPPFTTARSILKHRYFFTNHWWPFFPPTQNVAYPDFPQSRKKNKKKVGDFSAANRHLQLRPRDRVPQRSRFYINSTFVSSNSQFLHVHNRHPRIKTHKSLYQKKCHCV